MINLHAIDRYRITDPRALQMAGGWAGDENCGAFILPSVIDRADLRVIASNAEGWDHVSVSRINRPPNWAEMGQVASLFFQPHEYAMQLHVPESEHINNHPHCLHWWRPHEPERIPSPPSILVGRKELGLLDSVEKREAARRAMLDEFAGQDAAR